MNKKAHFRWGIIGCGNVCQVKSAPAYQQVTGFSLDAVMSRSLNKAKDFAQRHHIPRFYDNAEQLINDPQIDAIYIATPPDSHCEYALKIAEAGKICCVEKPMALHYAECQKMLQAFSAKDLPLFVAYYRRSLPGFKQIKSWLDDDLIGAVTHISWQYSRPPSELDLSQKYNWRTDSAIAPGGYFEDIASHGLDVMHFLLGNVSQAQGITSNQQKLYSAYDTIGASLLFASGVTGTGTWDFGSTIRQDNVRIDGELGTITFGIFTETPAILETPKTKQTAAMPKPTPIQLNFVQAIADHLAGKSTHPSLADSASHTNWLMDQILCGTH